MDDFTLLLDRLRPIVSRFKEWMHAGQRTRMRVNLMAAALVPEGDGFTINTFKQHKKLVPSTLGDGCPLIDLSMENQGESSVEVESTGLHVREMPFSYDTYLSFPLVPGQQPAHADQSNLPATVESGKKTVSVIEPCAFARLIRASGYAGWVEVRGYAQAKMGQVVYTRWLQFNVNEWANLEGDDSSLLDRAQSALCGG